MARGGTVILPQLQHLVQRHKAKVPSMGTTMQGSLGPMEVERVGGVSPTHPNLIGEWRTLVARALGRAGISQKVAAADMGISPQALSKQLAGTEHLSFWRMQALPPEFWQELLTLVCEFHGVSVGQSLQAQADAEIGKLMREVMQKAAA